MRHQTLTAEEVKAAVRNAWTEAEFTEQVIALAKSHGWLTAHFRPAKVMRGGVWKYETPVSGDGRGFVDLVLVHPIKRRVLWPELKSASGKLKPDQVKWRDTLLRAGAEWRLWAPADWDAIVEELSV